MPLITPQQTLEEYKILVIDQIDAAAGTVRARHITLAPGMELVYAENKSDAVWYIQHMDDDPPPSEVDVPALAVIHAVTGFPTLYQTAQYVLYLAEDWLLTHQLIEAKRLPAKEMVRLATNSADVDLAASIDWSSIP